MLITCCSGRSFFPLDAERVVARRAVYAYVAIYAYVRLKFHNRIIIQLIWVVGPARAARRVDRSLVVVDGLLFIPLIYSLELASAFSRSSAAPASVSLFECN